LKERKQELLPDGPEDEDGGKGGRRLWIPLIIILLVLIVVLGILIHKLVSGRGAGDASGGAQSGGSQGSATEPLEPLSPGTDGGADDSADGEDEQEALRAKVAAAYLAVLDEHESAIAGSVQFDGSYDNKISRPAAFGDVDGDGVEELFLLTSPGGGLEGNELHIYGYFDGEAKEISFEHMGWQGFSHYEVAGGGNFAVYTGKEPGTLYIYECTVDDGISYSLVRYRYDGGTEMKEDTVLTNWFWDHGDPNTRVDEYEENGEQIPAGEGGEKFSAGFADVDTALLFSTYRGTDEVSLWKSFDTDEAEAMTYQEMRSILESFI